MIAVVFYFLIMIISGIVCEILVSRLPVMNGSIAVAIIYISIILIWGGVLTSTILEAIREHIKNFYNLDHLLKSKVTYIAEMRNYKEEMKVVLLDTYKEFEQLMMQKVADSKIVATILKESNYASVVKTYENKIGKFINNINSCDRGVSETIKNLKSRQEDFVTGYGFFIPKRFRYTDISDKMYLEGNE